MIRETVSHLRDLPRYRQILASLMRYGYQDVVAALHLEGIVRPIERVALGDDVPPQDRARRLRMVCEDLGPTFVKLGQVLSTRHDLLPEAYTTELAALRDEVRPFPSDEAEAILKEEFGRPPAEVFARIDPVPIASASISQVHRATLHDGRLVALKIRRPGIEKVVHADLDILKNLAQLAEGRLAFLTPYAPVALVREFERTLKREMDFTIERRTMERCRRQFAKNKTAHIPYIVAEFSTPRVLAMEFIGGVGVNDREGLRRIGVDPAVAAVRGARILLTQIFEYGFFHADPHPGNLRVLPGGVIAPLDYGMFGQLDSRTRERIADLLSGLLSQDTDRVIRALNALEIRGEQVDSRALRRDVAELVASYSDMSLDTIDLGVLLRELIVFIRTHDLHIPPELVLLIRSLVTIEGVGRALDPHFDIAGELYPFIRDLSLKRFGPWRMLGTSIRTAEDVQRIATLLPDVLGQSLESIKRGKLTVHFDLQHFENLVRQLTRASHFLTVGIVLAGLLVGSAMILHVGSASLAYGGLSIGLVLGLWLLWSMSRS
ncbi:ABC1 kinase family protein [Singulisphaera sp. GP187]|uniref:ABC1 kinase family protein n=1 Tax=Singulisphaera sp. GP187 TaxID=1882752 RepID=UPI0009408F4C|nr:AarF/ABC1/UbiB kinase family protein [Singulisphaera sp. GP187]